MQVWARSAGSSAAFDTYHPGVLYFLSANPPATGVTFTSPPPGSSGVVGDNVVFTAAASGVSGSYQYQFWVNNGTSWSIGKPYGATNDNTWTWNTGGLTAGTYTVQVWVRNAGSPADWEAYATEPPYVLGP